MPSVFPLHFYSIMLLCYRSSTCSSQLASTAESNGHVESKNKSLRQICAYVLTILCRALAFLCISMWNIALFPQSLFCPRDKCHSSDSVGLTRFYRFVSDSKFLPEEVVKASNMKVLKRREYRSMHPHTECKVLPSWLMYLLCFTQSVRHSLCFGWWACSSRFAAWGKSSTCVAIIISQRKSQFQYELKSTYLVNVCELRALYCMFIALLQRNVSLERRKKMGKKKKRNYFGLLSSQVKNNENRKLQKRTRKSETVKRKKKLRHISIS